MRTPKKLMQQMALGLSLSPIPLMADDGFEIKTQIVYKNYHGSVEKRDGWERRLFLSKNWADFRIDLGYQYATADRFKSPDLRVKKPSVGVAYQITPQTQLGLSYLYIHDNLSPTDGGKVYGAHLKMLKLPGKISGHLGYYSSQYKHFKVTQYDAHIHKKFKWQGLNWGVSTGVKSIAVQRDVITPFTANAQGHYLAPQVMLNVAKNGYFARIGFIGKRAFAVGEQGQRVAHHALELQRSYLLAFGRKLKNLDLKLALGHHHARELPANNALTFDTFSAQINYRF